MKISRETITRVLVDDNTELKTNDKVMFATDSVCMAGTFKGISKRGDLTFYAKVKDNEVTFNVKPSSIKALEIL